MLPSMPVLFTRESQDAFGNKIEPSTSFFSQNKFTQPAIILEPPVPKAVEPVAPPKPAVKETKPKGNVKKKEEPPKFNNNALETALVRSYYTKIQSRYTSSPSVPNNKFIQFQNILKSFNPSNETPVELYKKVEELFGKDQKDILEDFLLFLKPGQAAKVGRFMDHFMLVQMTSFIEKLQSTFYRKPTVLRKILRALTTGINSGSSAEMKTRVLPHLRSNPRLSQMFKSLFPDERPLDSEYEAGADTINESFLTADKGYDVWEFQDETDNKKKIDATEGLDTMYLHGRVFLQHGRLLRSGSVTYPYSKEPYRSHSRRLAPTHCHLSPSESEEERASPKRRNASKIPPKKTKKQLKSPTKNVKDVNDNTKIKDLTNSSPKTGRRTQKKTVKEKKEDKSDTQKRKDKLAQKKDEASKPKQAKLQPVYPEVPPPQIQPRVSMNVHTPTCKQPIVTTAQSVVTTVQQVVTTVQQVVATVQPVITKKRPIVITVQPVVTTVKPVVTTVQPVVTTVQPVSTVRPDVCTVQPASKSNWTRDEDKTMLQVLKVEADSELVFGRVRQLLPHRSVTEIKERFCHVMTLLQQMAVGEVT